MQRTAWLTFVLLFVAIPAAEASPWENLLRDIELYEEVSDNDAMEIQQELDDAVLDGSIELFPTLEGEEGSGDPELSLSETHVTIRVDGVPVVLRDVPLDAWFALYIADAAELKLVSGYRDPQGRPTGEFGPADSVTIEQLAKMAVQAARVDQISCDRRLRNEGAIGRWSERFVACAEDLGWIVYSEGTVDVTRPATRAEVIVTVLQAFSVRIIPVSGTMFKDVTRSTTYGNAIETAAEEGIVAGYSDEYGRSTGYFGANDRVNRAETAKMFSNAASKYGD